MPESFRIEVRPDRRRVIVALHGELDVATVDEVAAEIDAPVDRGFDALVLDLRYVSFMDSSVHLLAAQAGRPDTEVVRKHER